MVTQNLPRTTTDFNFDWKFHKGDENKAWIAGFDDSNWRQVDLPHDWSIEGPFSEEYANATAYLPGGIGWYRKSFSINYPLENEKIYIQFDGIYNNSQVWCNGYYLGKRPYGYSSFYYDITPFVKTDGGDNVIAVRVDHSKFADSRWYTGSGIYRNVFLIITSNIHVRQYGTFITTPKVSSSEAEVFVKTIIVNDSSESKKIILRNKIKDSAGNIIKVIESTVLIESSEEKEVPQCMTIKTPSLWSVDNPYMYNALTEIVLNDKVIDQYSTPFGIRYFEFDANKGFSLNGVNMKIKGVCVHHDAGCLGAAVPAKVWIRRLEILKEMGCNAIRMSHNPPDPVLLDLCDKMGFLVMDEAFDEWEGVKNKWVSGHNKGIPNHDGYYEDFPEWSEKDLKDMIIRDRNHPSIILWSIGNEIDFPNDPYTHPVLGESYNPDKPNSEHLGIVAKKLAKIVKSLDATRPVTAALAAVNISNHTGFADALDVVGYNYQENRYDEDHKKYPDRVIYGSENGRNLEAWLAVKNNDYISAQFIWTGIDYLGEAYGWPIRNSQAGFLDLAAFKKPEFYYRKSLWNENPIVYLTSSKAKTTDNPSNRWGVRNDAPTWNYKEKEKVTVFCYTNCEEAELFLNEQSQGRKRLSDFPKCYITWNLEYTCGRLKVIGFMKGVQCCTHELQTSGVAEIINTKCDTLMLKADNKDIAHIEVTIDDKEGNLVYSSDNELVCTISGPASIIGIESGNPASHEDYKSPVRKVFHGKMLVFVKSTFVPGEIELNIYSDGLKPSKTILHSN